jgi:hypothetical protein
VESAVTCCATQQHQRSEDRDRAYDAPHPLTRHERSANEPDALPDPDDADDKQHKRNCDPHELKGYVGAIGRADRQLWALDLTTVRDGTIPIAKSSAHHATRRGAPNPYCVSTPCASSSR